MGMEQGGYTDNGNGGADFQYGYGAGGDEFAVDYASYYGNGGGGEIPYAEYTPMDLTPPQFESMPGGDLFGTYFDYYSGQGYDDYTAMQMAAESAGEGSIQISTYEQMAPEVLPELAQYFGLPYNPNYYDPWQSPPYIPEFDYYPLPPPPEKLGPCATPDGLPGYCPQGLYHPTWDPCACVPFPPSQGPSPQPTTPRPSGPTPSPTPLPSAPKPAPPKPPLPLQGATCVPKYGEWYNPSTGRCEPLPKCPTGYVFDPFRGGCVRSIAQVSPLPRAGQPSGAAPGPGVETDIMAELKKIPWWVWLALGGLFLLNTGDNGGKKTTVTYRRR